MIPTAFAASFRRQFADLEGFPLLVALSGGADSVALLLLLSEAASTIGCAVRAAHVHHHLRGAEADADAAFCADLCHGLGVPLAILHLDPRPPRGVSPEAWWRRERYRLLERDRIETGCAAVATAHTADDQAETVLLKLLRGSGPRGVAGIRRRHGAVIRPLLAARRNELRDFLTRRRQVWREDSSNALADRPRTRLRAEFLPALLAVEPRAIERLAAFAEMLAEDEAILGSLVAALPRPEVGRPAALAPVRALAPGLRARWVLALAETLPLEEAPSRRQLAEFAAMLDGGHPAAVDLGRRWVLRRRGARLHLSPPPCAPFAPVAATLPSEIVLPGGFVARLGQEGAGTYRARLNGKAAEGGLCWRCPRPGERDGEQTLAASLAGAGVPAEWRRAWPLLERGGTMIWIPGVRVAQGWESNAADAIVAELEEPCGCRPRS